MRTLPLLALAAVLFTACGPTAGDKCKGLVFTCDSDTVALECRDDVWRAVPCRGTDGCKAQDGKVSCDVSKNQAGDACAQSQEGEAICTPDGRGVLECRQGLLVLTRSCSSCSRTSTQLVCNP